MKVRSVRQRGGELWLIRDVFKPEHRALGADFACCLSVLEHILSPLACIEAVRASLPSDGGLYFEVFNAERAFRQQETWSIHYEQCNYFSRDSFRNLFQSTGFAIRDSGACYEKAQYLYVEAVLGPRPNPRSSLEERILPTELEEFGEAHRRRLELWQERLHGYRKQGKKVIVWGTGGKGITFLNSLPTSDLIPYVLEINPRRQGKFVPGSGQRIVAPGFLTCYRPDVVIITNALYEKEMKEQAAQFGVFPEFVVA